MNTSDGPPAPIAVAPDHPVTVHPRIRLILDAIAPACDPVMMGTGIVSIGLLLDGRSTLSAIMLVLAAGVWVALVGLLLVRAVGDRTRLLSDLRRPAALGSSAAAAVLGTRLALLGWVAPAIALLVVAVGLWLVLAPRVLAAWEVPTVGGSFLLAVAAEALALLGSTVALAQHASWLAVAMLVPFAVGLACYAFVLSRFGVRELAVGGGDHWVSGGALAISAAAAGHLALAAHDTGALGGAVGALKVVALVLWCLAVAWLPALLIAEVLHPRPGYSLQRWSTVFPVGMYAVCSFIVGSVVGIPAITDFAQVWVWVGLAAWLVVFAGMIRRAPGLLRGSPEPGPTDA